MVEVEERRLGAFEQQVGAGRQGVVEEADGVGDVRRQPAPSWREAATTSSTSSASPPVASSWRFSAIARGHLVAERRQVEHVAGAHADAAGLVGVGRADALERGADLVVATQASAMASWAWCHGKMRWARLDTCSRSHEMPRAVEGVDLGEQGRQVDDDAVADDGMTWS